MSRPSASSASALLMVETKAHDRVIADGQAVLPHGVIRSYGLERIKLASGG